MSNEKSFLELIGAIVVSIFVFLFIYWVGWIFFMVLFWGAFTGGIFYLINEGIATKKYFENFLYALGASFFSAVFFWWGLSYFSKTISNGLHEILIFYPIIVISLAILVSKIFKK